MTELKNMKHLIIGILFVLTIILCGCTETLETTQSDAQKIVGTWKGIQYFNNTAVLTTYIFSSDATYNITTLYGGEANSVNGTWEITENICIITQGNQTINLEYLFADSGNQLTFVDNGAAYTLIRQ